MFYNVSYPSIVPMLPPEGGPQWKPVLPRLPARSFHPKPGMPFDPEDLSRRLNMVIADRERRARACAERERLLSLRNSNPTLPSATAANPEQTPPVTYSHVSTYTATQFEAIIASDEMRSAQLGAGPPYHLQGNARQANNQAALTPKPVDDEHTESKKGMTKTRPRILQPAHLFSSSKAVGHYRYHSTGATAAGGAGESRASFEISDGVRGPFSQSTTEESDHRLLLDPATINERRVDWTQHDQEVKLKAQHGHGRIPILKKADSIWGFRGSLGSFSWHHNNEKEKGKDKDKVSIIGKVSLKKTLSGGSRGSLKSSKAIFFFRFRR